MCFCRNSGNYFPSHCSCIMCVATFYFLSLTYISFDLSFPYLLQAWVSWTPWDSTISEPLDPINDAKPLCRYNNSVITKHDGKHQWGCLVLPPGIRSINLKGHEHFRTQSVVGTSGSSSDWRMKNNFFFKRICVFMAHDNENWALISSLCSPDLIC